MLKGSLLVAAIFMLSVTGRVEAAPPSRDMVPDGETAVAVASAILKTFIGKTKFDDMVIQWGTPIAASNGDTWTVSFPPMRDIEREIHHPDGSTTVIVTAGGGIPTIEISKRDAQVTDIYLTR